MALSSCLRRVVLQRHRQQLPAATWKQKRKTAGKERGHVRGFIYKHTDENVIKPTLRGGAPS